MMDAYDAIHDVFENQHESSTQIGASEAVFLVSSGEVTTWTCEPYLLEKDGRNAMIKLRTYAFRECCGLAYTTPRLLSMMLHFGAPPDVVCKIQGDDWMKATWRDQDTCQFWYDDNDMIGVTLSRTELEHMVSEFDKVFELMEID